MVKFNLAIVYAIMVEVRFEPSCSAQTGTVVRFHLLSQSRKNRLGSGVRSQPRPGASASKLHGQPHQGDESACSTQNTSRTSFWIQYTSTAGIDALRLIAVDLRRLFFQDLRTSDGFKTKDRVNNAKVLFLRLARPVA